MLVRANTSVMMPLKSVIFGTLTLLLSWTSLEVSEGLYTIKTLLVSKSRAELMDDKSQISATGLKQIADFVNDSVEIGEGDNQNRFGLVLFDENGTTAFDLTEFNTTEDVVTAVINQSYSEGDTNIISGMYEAVKVFKNASETEHQRVMIIITDGSDDSDVASARREAKNYNISIFAIGVGIMVESVQLEQAAKGRVFLIKTYYELQKTLNKICANISSIDSPHTKLVEDVRSCGCENTKLDELLYWLDIVFVLDSSDGVGEEKFLKVNFFICELLRRLPYLYMQIHVTE
ncbi:unnamed protein product [Enterobius vermicularis]|uniref:VWFA domain-containing protein n=1 Tax=Enterobius vermicularis TaxID=51028 RepID=A0A0N4V1D9_ENTVE|nr:unnamed protein product [Enterobius vermicularis]